MWVFDEPWLFPNLAIYNAILWELCLNVKGQLWLIELQLNLVSAVVETLNVNCQFYYLLIVSVVANHNLRPK